MFVGLLAGIFLFVGNMMVTILQLPGTLYHFYTSVIGNSPRFGPVFKTVMALFFPVLAILSIPSVGVISLLAGTTSGLYFSPADCVQLAYRGVAAYATVGYQWRKEAYAYYRQQVLVLF